MLRSFKIIGSEYITHSTNGFYDSAVVADEEKLLYARASLLRQMHLYNVGMVVSGLMIAILSVYAMTL